MSDLNLYWGELHNHNELGYAQGSLERSYEIARSHLDFYAFTPHGLHADGGVPDGYPVVVANWERIRRAASENNRPGEFTCFPAYEWHSSAWGIYTCSASRIWSRCTVREVWLICRTTSGIDRPSWCPITRPTSAGRLGGL